MNSSTPLTNKTRRIGHLDLPGAGQVSVSGNHAYVGHITNKNGLGTSIVDISDKKNPRLVAQVMLDDPDSHSHKVRVVGDIMVVNHERNMSAIGRRAEQLPAARRDLTAALGREPNAAEIAAKMQVTPDDLKALEEFEKRGYSNGGFKVYDVSNPAKPKEICHHKTGGVGVHRFAMDERYAYISTEMKGYIGNILVIYDMRDPAKPQEVSRWWMPGQHIEGGEKPTWAGKRHRLHHALRFGNEMWASCWHGGAWAVDISDLSKPKTLGSVNYHPLLPEPTHTVMPAPGTFNGKRVALAIDEEDHAISASEMAARRGRLHAGIVMLDVTDTAAMKPLSLFYVSEMDSPFSRADGARFGAHQFHERVEGTLVFAVWFAGGLRIIDIKDPTMPQEVGWFIPEPCGGRSAPQSNDVVLDEKKLIYVVDRYVGLDIVEFAG